MSRFSEEIIFPRGVDNFPNLSDQFFGDDPSRSIVFAEHFNKIRNVILKVSEVYSTSSMTASGDGSISGLAYTYSMRMKLSDLVRVNRRNLDLRTPGNVLPFEFVITSSGDDYSNWALNYTGNSASRVLVQGPLDMVSTITAGMNIFQIYPAVTVNLSRQGLGDRITSGPDGFNTASYLCGGYASVDNDTLVVRGYVIDTDIQENLQWPQASRWLLMGQYFWLTMTIMGVKE